MRLGLAEIFEKVETAKTQEERVNILRQHGHGNTGLLQILVWIGDPSTPWHPDLIKERVTWKVNPYLDQQMILYQSVRKIPRLFFKDGQEMDADKRRLLWVLFLEGIDKDDARVLESVRLRATLPYKAITRKLVMEAFPGLLGEEVPA